MSILVLKFGGTSMATIERIQTVAKRVVEAKADAQQVVVIVSAMSGETDRLIKLAKALHPAPTPREYAALLATGEQVASSLLCLALQHKGYQARSLNGTQAGIFTDDQHRQARIMDIDNAAIKQHLDNDEIVVITGFQGRNQAGDITTLGRGGSDTSAVAIAASLQAAECQIFTDVDGIYTADPRIVPQAHRIDTISFAEMLELASLGSKVLQTRAVEFASKYQLPLRVLSTFIPGPGTLITAEGDKMEAAKVSGIAYNRSEAMLNIAGIPDSPGVAASIFKPLSEAAIDVDMIIQDTPKNGLTDLSFTVHRDNFQQAHELIESVTSQYQQATVQGSANIAKLSIVGLGMRSHHGIANTLFSALAEAGINIRLISTSEIKVSVLIDEKHLELGVRTLHSAFGLSTDPTEEFDPKWTKVGRSEQ